MSSLACSLAAVLLLLAGQVRDEEPKRQPPADDVKQFDGLWSGSWGGGESNGTVFQPVLAEMMIDGEKFELLGFRGVNQAWGLIHIDPATKKLKITTAKAGDSPSRVVEYSYKISDAGLTLTDSENVAIELHKVPLQSKPLVSTHIDIVIAEGFNKDGRLLTTEQSPVKVGRSTSIRYSSSAIARKLDESAIFVTGEDTMRKISIDDARKLLKPSTPVAIAYRSTDSQVPKITIGLREFQGIPQPDSDAGLGTLTRMLRPGTLVFIVDTQLAIPEP